MLKRALTFVKKICLKRGYIFYVPYYENSTILKGDNNFFIPTAAVTSVNKTNVVVRTTTAATIKQKKKTESNDIANVFNTFSNVAAKTEFNLVFLSPEYFSFSKQRGMLYAFTQKRKTLPILFNKHSFFANNARSNSFQLFIKPEALFVLHTNTSTALIKEAVKLQIPIIGIINSHSNPYAVAYPISGNNESQEALNLYTELLLNTILDAKKSESKTFLTGV
jgi:hypothetical protein